MVSGYGHLRCLVALAAAMACGVSAAPVREGLVLWLDASDLDADGRPEPVGGPVAVGAWQGRSSVGHRGVQPRASARPTWVPGALGARPVVRFDGDDFLSLGQPAALDFKPRAPFTIAVVAAVPGDGLGTFIAKGGGAAGQRAYQLYATHRNLGGIAYGVMREGPRAPGAMVAVQVCDGRRCDLYRNGEACLSFPAGAAPSQVDVLVGSRRKNADNTGTYYMLRGDIAELLVYNRALSETELTRLGRYLGERYGIAVAASPAEAIRKLAPLDAAERLCRAAHANHLKGELAAAAAALLVHDDPFVRGLAEWAIAMKVGGENNGQETRWPRPDSPAWFRTWMSVPAARQLEADWVRQAVSRGIHRDGRKLLADADAMVARAGRMAAEFGLHPSLLEPLRASRDALARAPADLARQRRLWLDVRRAMRAVVLANPAVAFRQTVFVKQFAAHTVRNITRSYQWKHKPGGDICVLTALGPEAEVRPVIKGRLGRGFVWGLDLSWDADRAVFGYARQPVWPPAVNTAHYNSEGQNVFSLRKTHPPMHIHEVGIDGASLRQLTDHPYWNDFEPTWCADGSVVFASDRCGRSAQCGNETYDHMNPNLYIRSPDGRIRQLTDNKDIDRYPHSLDDGRIAYTHWEYQERHFMEVHSIWTVRPDGTMSDALFKHHMRAPCALRDTRSIPGSAQLVSIATGHHTFASGPVVIVDPAKGMNSDDGIAIVTPGVRVQEGKMVGRPVAGGGVPDAGGLYHTPFAISDTCFLVSYAYARPSCTAPGGVDSNGFGIYLIDVYGNRELLHRDPLFSCTFPIPLRPRPRPPLLPPVAPGEGAFQASPSRARARAPAPARARAPAPARARARARAPARARSSLPQPATCYVTDVYDGMPGVPRGTVKFIRIAQHVGWPLDPKRGAMHYIPGNAGGRHLGFHSWSPVRVIGTVPVEADGSAHFTVPADTAVYFQALDARHMEVLRMRSMVSLKAGEVRGCRGCHQSQARAPASTPTAPLALRSPADTPKPPPWGAQRMLGYEWLVQPILDRHCVRCHGHTKPDGGIDLSPTRAPDGLLQSYRSLFGALPGRKKRGRRLVSVANRFDGADVTSPKQFGSHKSPLIAALGDALHKKEVKLTEADWLSLVTWVDANAPYHDAFVSKRPADGGKPRRDVPARPLPPVAAAR